MPRKYLAPDLTVLQNKIDFLVVYHKYITDNHFHLQCLINKKPYFFVVQIFDEYLDIYDAKNDFLHTFSKDHPAFLEFAENKMDGAINIIGKTKDQFLNHRPGIHSLTTPEHEQSIVYDVSDLKEAA